MKSIVKKIEILCQAIVVFGLLYFISGCKELPAESKSVTDSTIIVKEAIPVTVKGGKVVKQLNIDSLKALYSSGQINRYYTITDKNGTARLDQRIDLLTGHYYAECTARDSIFNLLKETREHYRTEQKTVQLPPGKPTFWQNFQKWFNTNLLVLILVFALVFLIQKRFNLGFNK